MDTRLQEWLDEVCDDHSVTHATGTHVLHIKIGPGMTPGTKYQMLEAIGTHVLRNPYLQSVNVTAFTGSWTQRLHDDIEGCLHHNITFRVRVVDPDSCLEFTQTWLGLTSSTAVPLRLMSTASASHATHNASVTFALDGVTRRNLARISHLEHISRLTIRGRYNTEWTPTPKDIARASDHLVNFLVKSREALGDLEEVTLSLDFQENIESILIGLQEASSITTLKLMPPTNFASLAVIRNSAMAIQRGMDSKFSRLIELVLPTEYVSAGGRALGNFLESKFEYCTDSRLADDGKLVMFYDGPGLRLVYKRPFMFLPVKLF